MITCPMTEHRPGIPAAPVDMAVSATMEAAFTIVCGVPAALVLVKATRHRVVGRVGGPHVTHAMTVPRERARERLGPRALAAARAAEHEREGHRSPPLAAAGADGENAAAAATKRVAACGNAAQCTWR